MSQLYRTKNCVICGKPAIHWTGCVIAYQKMAFGNLCKTKVFAGRCLDHTDQEIMFDMNYKNEFGIDDKDLFGRTIKQEKSFIGN